MAFSEPPVTVGGSVKAYGMGNFKPDESALHNKK